MHYPHPWTFLGTAFSYDGPQRGFGGTLFILGWDSVISDICPSGLTRFWLILFVLRQVS
jgi:hypothetical protein